MKVGVLLKQVPASDTIIKINPDKTGIVTAGIKWETNPYDELALEAALQLKDAGKATGVVVLTVGAADADARVRDALSRGATEAIRVDEASVVGSDSLGTTRALAAAAKAAGVELIFAGKQAIDTDSAAVPAMVAELLGWPQVSVVTGLTVDGGKITAERNAGGGFIEVVSTSVPAVITCDKGLNTPRFANMKGIMAAKKIPIEVKSAADLGLSAGQVGAAGALVEESGLELPPPRPSGKIIQGATPEAKVKELVRLLRDEAKVI